MPITAKGRHAPPLVSRTRCSASSAVHRRAGTHHAGPRLLGPGSAAHHSANASCCAAHGTRYQSWPRILAAHCARAFQFVCPLKSEGAGNAGCALHPRSRVPKIAHWAHTSIQGSGNTPTSPAQWLYGLLRALPGERAFLPPSPLRRLLLKSLTPASRRQDHTTSPYALAFSSGAKNAPDAKASTASRAPRVVTIMIRPSCGRETGAVIILISRNVKRNIFDSGA